VETYLVKRPNCLVQVTIVIGFWDGLLARVHQNMYFLENCMCPNAQRRIHCKCRGYFESYQLCRLLHVDRLQPIYSFLNDLWTKIIW